jgi:hypothetical protein
MQEGCQLLWTHVLTLGRYGSIVVVEIHHLVAVVQATVRLRRGRRLVLCRADGAGLKVLQGVSGQVVKV